jgi:hypothetical protein
LKGAAGLPSAGVGGAGLAAASVPGVVLESCTRDEVAGCRRTAGPNPPSRAHRAARAGGSPIIDLWGRHAHAPHACAVAEDAQVVGVGDTARRVPALVAAGGQGRVAGAPRASQPFSAQQRAGERRACLVNASSTGCSSPCPHARRLPGPGPSPSHLPPPLPRQPLRRCPLARRAPKVLVGGLVGGHQERVEAGEAAHKPEEDEAQHAQRDGRGVGGCVL